MKITREQALDLVKVLSHYQTLGESVDVDVHGLCASFEDYLLNEGEGYQDEEDEEDEGTYEKAPRKKNVEEPYEQEDDQGAEADDEGEEADSDNCSDEEGTEYRYVAGIELNNLKKVKATVIESSVNDANERVTLEFLTDEESNLDCELFVNGESACNVTYILRKANELHVAEGRNRNVRWHTYHISKFPKGWVELLPLNGLIEID